jgi:hypothetical protein
MAAQDREKENLKFAYYLEGVAGQRERVSDHSTPAARGRN